MSHDSLQHNNELKEASLNRFLYAIPSDLRQEFSARQIRAIQDAFLQQHWKKHPIDVRMSIPCFNQRFYITFLAGKERRSYNRLRADKLSQNLIFLETKLFIPFALLCLAVLGVTMCTVGIRYWQKAYSKDAHPTVLPWVRSHEDCQGAFREWRDNACYDAEQSPDF